MMKQTESSDSVYHNTLPPFPTGNTVLEALEVKQIWIVTPDISVRVELKPPTMKRQDQATSATKVRVYRMLKPPKKKQTDQASSATKVRVYRIQKVKPQTMKLPARPLQ